MYTIRHNPCMKKKKQKENEMNKYRETVVFFGDYIFLLLSYAIQ